MRVYLGKQINLTSTDVPATHETVRELVRKVEGAGHKIFTSPKFVSDLHHRKVSACGIICRNRKEMPPNFSAKMSTTVSRAWGNLRAVCSKDKQGVYARPTCGNFKEGAKALKPLSIEDYTIHMGYVDLS
jgi:hypothetical protein